MQNPFLDAEFEGATFTASDGQWIAYVEAGNATGRPVLFVHGAGMDHRLWSLQLRAFRDRFRCIAVDVRGHGRSRPTGADFDVERAARDVVELSAHLEVEGPVWIGQSLGSLLGQVAVREKPGWLWGIVHVDGVDISRGFGLGAVLGMRSARPMLAAWPYSHLAKTVGETTATTRDARDYARESLLELGRADFLRVWRMVEKTVRRRAWTAYQPPERQLLVVGREDGVGYCRREADAWAERAGTRAVWLEGAGHNSNQDAPEAFNQALSSFLDRG